MFYLDRLLNEFDSIRFVCYAPALPQMALFNFSDDDFADDGDDSDIRDGPGPGMEELDLGFDGGPGILDFGR